MFCSFAILVLETIFFIIFLISYIHHVTLSTTGQYSTNSSEFNSYTKAIIAMEFLMFIFGVSQFVFYVLTFKCENHFLFMFFTVFSFICFIICWILSIVFFCKSPEYQFIRSANEFDSTKSIKIYSFQSFKDQIEKWSQQDPVLCLQTIGSTKNKICSSLVNITTSKNVKHSFDDDGFNFKDITGDSLMLVDLHVELQWNNENEKKIQLLQEEMATCSKNILMASNVTRLEGLQNVPDMILMTKTGKMPKKLTKGLALTRGIFGLGLDVINDLSSIPVYDRTIKITESTFNYTFDCSKFDYQCHDVPDENEIYEENKELFVFDDKLKEEKTSFWEKVKKMIVSKNLNLFSKKSPKEYQQRRLSRSFYLSKSAYSGDFSCFDFNGEKTYFKSEELMSVKMKNLQSDIFKPVWYLGTVDKELYVVIRGSYSLTDWITDASYHVEINNKNSYHIGFYYAARYVWGDIFKTVIDYRKKGYTIIFTGHSYGGSVAQILHQIAASYILDVYSYVFGAPASMGKTVAAQIKSNCYSFIYCNDLAPRVMNYVTALKKSKWLNNPMLNQFFKEIYVNRLQKSKDWTSSGSEEITEPVGTIYHLPYRTDDKSKWGSISSCIKTINFWFYAYDLNGIQHAIDDHKLEMYYQFLGYEDGLIPPESF